ncbi:MAG: TetR/AcrR family transcriptional regulator [Sinobacteraceae bacterium]|nr:TetR/AcrR family transcriptional regulator [Nevskiaceae bacterium]
MAYRRSALMQERLANNRERILAAARELVASGGFREAQISAIAAQAGVSTGMIYRYFPSKSELFIEVLTAAVKHEIEILERIRKGSGSARERLYTAIESFTRRALTGPNLAYAFIAEPAEPEVDTARIRARKQLSSVFKAILQEGIARGEFPPQDVDASAACIVGAYTEALIGPLRHSRTRVKDREKLIVAISEFCVRAVSKPDGSLRLRRA